MSAFHLPRPVCNPTSYDVSPVAERKLLLLVDIIQRVKKFHVDQERVIRQNNSFTQPYRTFVYSQRGLVFLLSL